MFSFKKVMLIAFCPLIILVDMYLLTEIFELISSPSDMAVFAATLLLFVFVVINYLIIKFFINIFKK